MAIEEPYRFKSSLFQVVPNEDKLTNSFCFGKQLAEWIRLKFIEFGYPVEEVIADDWGFCVMLKRDPYRLLIACGNEESEEWQNPEVVKNNISSLVWYCFCEVEIPFLRKCSKKVLAESQQDKFRVNHLLKQLFEVTDGIDLI